MILLDSSILIELFRKKEKKKTLFYRDTAWTSPQFMPPTVQFHYQLISYPPAGRPTAFRVAGDQHYPGFHPGLQ